jgi:hypothetical protein
MSDQELGERNTTATGSARPKDRECNVERCRADYGYGHPGRNLSAGTAGQTVSEEVGKQGSENRDQAIAVKKGFDSPALDEC